MFKITRLCDILSSSQFGLYFLQQNVHNNNLIIIHPEILDKWPKTNMLCIVLESLRVILNKLKKVLVTFNHYGQNPAQLCIGKGFDEFGEMLKSPSPSKLL